jgi:Arc/MetJ family transcription regulator
MRISMLETVDMRTTIALDDELVNAAAALTGISEKTSRVRHALTKLVEWESAKLLASLGGTMPDLEDIPRRTTSNDTGRRDDLS